MVLKTVKPRRIFMFKNGTYWLYVEGTKDGKVVDIYCFKQYQYNVYDISSQKLYHVCCCFIEICSDTFAADCTKMVPTEKPKPN